MIRYEIQVQAKLIRRRPTPPDAMIHSYITEELIVIPWKRLYTTTLKTRARKQFNRFCGLIDMLLSMTLHK